jgi:hypothetical protein
MRENPVAWAGRSVRRRWPGESVQHRRKHKATLGKYHGTAQFAGLAWFQVQMVASFGVEHHAVAELACQFLRPGTGCDHQSGDIAEAQFAIEAHPAVHRLHAAYAFLHEAAAQTLELRRGACTRQRGDTTKPLSGWNSPLT